MARAKPRRLAGEYSSHFDRSINERAFSMSLWTWPEIPGIFAYHGHTVLSEWQFWQARSRIVRIGTGTPVPASKGFSARWLVAPPDVADRNVSAAAATTANPARTLARRTAFFLTILV